MLEILLTSRLLVSLGDCAMDKTGNPGKPSKSTIDPEGPGCSWECNKGDTTTAYLNSYDSEVEVVRPYAIEEPDDESARKPPASSGSTPQWQRDLVDSLEELEFESDSSSGSSLWSDQTRGQKRKSASVDSRSPQRRATLQPDSDPHDRPNASPKRQCKKDTRRKAKIDLESANAALLSHESPQPRSSVSSGSDMQQTDGKHAGSTPNTTTMMDLD